MTIITCGFIARGLALLSETYEESLNRRRQEAKEHPPASKEAWDGIIYLKEIGPPRGSKDDPLQEYLGWKRESARLMVRER